MDEPIAVNIINFFTGILAMPAGNDINCLIIGNSLPKKVDMCPYLWKNDSTLSSDLFESKKYFPYFLKKLIPYL